MTSFKRYLSALFFGGFCTRALLASFCFSVKTKESIFRVKTKGSVNCKLASMATRVFELLILLYSGAEMTMTSLSKFFIADMLKKQLQQGDNNDDDDGAFGLYNSTTAVPVTIAALLNLSEISNATSHLGLTNLTSVDADHSGFQSGYHGMPTEEEEWGQEEDAELQRILAWYLTLSRIVTFLPWVILGPIFGRWTNR